MQMLFTIVGGVPMTLFITIVALGIGVLGGIPLLLARRSRFFVPRLIARVLIELLRGIPPIVWLFIVFYGFANALPALTPILAAVIGLGLISCAYMAEIYRGGMSSIAAGQWEAAEALGMNHRSVLAKVIGPQVFRVSVPAGATYAIGLLKDSSVAYTIGVSEIVFYANDQSRQTSAAILPFVVAAAVYIVMTIPCAWGARSLDAKLRRRVAR